MVKELLNNEVSHALGGSPVCRALCLVGVMKQGFDLELDTPPPHFDMHGIPDLQYMHPNHMAWWL